MEDILIPLMAFGTLFIGLPWIILHYITRWKTNASLTAEDENLLDDLYHLARRLDDRMNTIERILAADNPNWNGLGNDRLGNDRLGNDRPGSDRPAAPARPLLEKSPEQELSDIRADIDRLRSAGEDRSPVGRA